MVVERVEIVAVVVAAAAAAAAYQKWAEKGYLD